jgi:hypothetical protein
MYNLILLLCCILLLYYYYYYLFFIIIIILVFDFKVYIQQYYNYENHTPVATYLARVIIILILLL